MYNSSIMTVLVLVDVAAFPLVLFKVKQKVSSDKETTFGLLLCV